MSDAIKQKIRKLLAVANDGRGDLNSAANALKLAHDLMEKYGIEDVGEDQAATIDIVRGDIMSGFDKKWHTILGNAIGMLYGCQYMNVRTKSGDIIQTFIGAQYQLDAAGETFLFVADQIEQFYKIALKAFDGALTKAQRVELRASFKEAAALRIAARVIVIMEKPSRNALVVVDTIRARIDAMMDEANVSNTKIVPKLGFGSGVGFNAGGLVQIQKEVRR